MSRRPGGAAPGHDAFVDCTSPHLDAVWNVARRMAADPASAEDLVQETYLRAYRGFAGKRDGDVRAWLVSICLNTARSDMRRRRRRPVEQLGPVPEGEPVAPAAEGTALVNLEREWLWRALDALPEPQRTAVVLADLAGLSATEVACCTGAPRGTVLARIHRGRRRLAAALVSEGATDAL